MSQSGESEFRKDSMLRKSSTLSAKELFQWRKKENLSVPQRGGAKDCEPDNTWLQDKRLEAFYEEHLSVLSEPRVEKSGNLVKGTWNPEMRLVNIEKTAKFWMKMGFVDQQRNWLHPEEAMFLMEVNCLEVFHQDLSLSLQEAYSLLLHPACGVSEEEYQVYAHLRRLGFIVIRHAGKLDLTAYERKIGLDKHMKKKSKKHLKKTDNLQNSDLKASSHTKPDSDIKCTDNQQKERQADIPALENQISDSGMENKNNRKQNQKENTKGDDLVSKNPARFFPLHTEQGCRSSGACNTRSQEKVKDSHQDDPLLHSQNCNKRTKQIHAECSDLVVLDTVSEEPPAKKARTDAEDLERVSDMPSAPCDVITLDPWTQATKLSLSKESSTSLSTWDFSLFDFPNMGGTGTVSLSVPPPQLLPPNTCVDEEFDDMCLFDVEDYRQQQQLQQGSVRDQEEGYGHLKHLEFSYAEWYQSHCKPVAAKNWREWKAELHQRENSFVTESPVAHLWQGEVTPLVQPKDAVSTASLLEKLSVIQPFEGPFPVKHSPESVKITFDVYLPNTSFKKSSPGLPDHRVCVARGDQPPDVFEVHAVMDHLGDGVPLHWAVINCGEISFFVFDDIDLPVHLSSLG